MTSKTWIGGDGNDASDPANWSPGEAPQPGDTLDMQGGTMNIRDDDLAGNTLVIGQSQRTTSPTTLNLSQHADVSMQTALYSTDSVTINVGGSDTLNLAAGFPSATTFTVNLADHARLAGSIDMTFGSAVFAGGSGSRYVNNGSDVVRGSRVTLDTDVRGQGSFTVHSAQSSGGQLEFGGSVSRGQTVTVSGDPYRLVRSQLQIDQPAAFKGAVALDSFGEVDLVGLANAESYQLKNDILSIYSGCNEIERLRLTLPPPVSGTPLDLTVAQTATGILIDRGGYRGGGTLLPTHDGSGPGSTQF